MSDEDRYGQSWRRSPDGMTLPPPPVRSGGGIVRRSAALAGRRAGPLLRVVGPLALLAAVPGALAQAGAARDMGLDWEQMQMAAPPDMDPGWLGAQAGAGLLDFAVLVPLLLTAAYLVLRGEGGSPLREAVRAWPRAIGATVLAMLAAIVPLVPGMVLFAITFVVAGFGLMDPMQEMGPGMGSLMMFGALSLLAGIAVGAFIALSLGLAVPIAVLDGRGPVQAVRESWTRMRGQRLRLLGGNIVLGLPVLVLTLLLVLIADVLPGVFLPALLAGTVSGLASAAVWGAVSTVIHTDTRPAEPAMDAGEDVAPGDPDPVGDPPPLG